MKTKLLFYSAVAFLFMGLHSRDGALYYFFSVYCFMLFIGIFIHKHAYNPRTEEAGEPLPEAGSAKK
jgi:hypothetical protein